MSISNATMEPLRKKKTTKPSYKMMIIAAITSQGKSGPGLSRQEIASYLQQNYPVSIGSRFNAALQSALKSGINSGIFVFDESNQRFNLNEEQTSQRKQRMNSRKKTARKRRQNESKRAKESQTFKFDFNFNIVLNEGEDNNPTKYRVVPIEIEDPGDDSKASDISQSTLNARTDNKDENNVHHSNLCRQQTMDTDGILQMKMSHLALLKLVEASEKQSDLFGVLRYCALKDLKKICVDTISKMDENNARNVHRNVFPINVVLPEDIIGHILSFDNVNHHRRVCQQWNLLNQQNEEKMLRDMYQSVDDRNIEPLGPGMATVILHPTRPRLHPIEIRRGYTRVVSSLNDVPADARVLVHLGWYRDQSALCFRKSAQYIGVVDNCRIELQYGVVVDNYRGAMGLNATPEGKHHFENIRINISGGMIFMNFIPGTISFEQCSFEFHDSGLLMAGSPDDSTPVVFKRCTFQMCSTIAIKGSADVIDCHFNCNNDSNTVLGAITILSGAGKVHLRNNTFANCCDCVRLGAACESYSLIEFTNNRFHNTMQHHIRAIIPKASNANAIQNICVLQGNTSTGTRSWPILAGPNQIHWEFYE